MTDIKALYGPCVSTDDGQFRVCAGILRPGETYNGPYAHAFLDQRDEVLLDLSDLQPNTILRIIRELQLTFLNEHMIIYGTYSFQLYRLVGIICIFLHVSGQNESVHLNSIRLTVMSTLGIISNRL